MSSSNLREKESDIHMLQTIKIRWLTLMDNVREGDSKARKWLIIYIGILLFIVVGIVGLVRMNLGYSTFEVTDIIDKNDDVSVNYQVIGDGLIRYSKDGASYSDKDGSVLWNQTFEMSNARVAACGNYMAIGDIGSNQIRIFNQAGQIAVINALYPLSAIEIASQGVVAAVLSDSEQHYINLYDATGADLVRIRATMTQSGYPVDIALSEDGTKLAVSYLMINDGDVTTQIVFYKFGDLEKTDYIAGTYNYNEIFPKIQFINNNTLVTFGEGGFEIYTFRDGAPSLVLANNFEREIKSIFYNEQYIGFVFRNEGSDDTAPIETGVSLNAMPLLGTSPETNVVVPEGSPEGRESELETTDSIYPSLSGSTDAAGGSNNNGYRYRMLVYTNAGRLYLDKEFNFDYHQIVCSNYEIILYNDNECVMFEYNGNEKFRYEFDSRISSLLPKESRNEYIIIDDNTIREILLK